MENGEAVVSVPPKSCWPLNCELPSEIICWTAESICWTTACRCEAVAVATHGAEGGGLDRSEEVGNAGESRIGLAQGGLAGAVLTAGAGNEFRAAVAFEAIVPVLLHLLYRFDVTGNDGKPVETSRSGSLASRASGFRRSRGRLSPPTV